LEKVSEREIELLEERFNNSPRKCLRFLTPDEVKARRLKASKDS